MKGRGRRTGVTRGLVRVPVLSLGVVAILAIAAGTQALAGGSDPFEPPPEGTLTVSPAPPGMDYKSNPAEPEVVRTYDGPVTVDALQEAVDPGDDPTILVCVSKDGETAIIQYVTPAEKGAKVDPDAADAKVFAEAEFINDKGEC